MALDFDQLSRALEEEPAVEPQIVEPQFPMKLDPAVLKLQLVPYEKALDQLIVNAESLQVNDDASRALGVNMAALAKDIDKKISTWHKDKKAPFLEAGKIIDNLKNIFADRCTKIIGIIKGKDRAYQAELDLENARLRKEKEEADRKLQEAMNKKAKELGVEAPKVETPAFVPQPRAVKTESGSITYREVWKWEVVDIALVGRKYLQVNEKLINQDVKGGLRQADGLRIWMDKEPVLR